MKDDDCGNLVAAAVPKKVDVLLNNAGILETDNFENINSAKYLQQAKDMFEVNALGPVKITSALSPKLRNGKGVMMSSLREA